MIPKYFDDVDLLPLSDAGPVGLIGGCRVVIGHARTGSSVWIERPKWGWSNGNQLFVGHNHVEKATRYAEKLKASIRRFAEREQSWREGADERKLHGALILAADCLFLDESSGTYALSEHTSAETQETKRKRIARTLLGDDAEDYSPIYEDRPDSIGLGCTWVGSRKVEY